MTDTLKGIDHMLTFPACLLSVLKVLPLAATTGTKVLARRFASRRRRLQDLDRLCLDKSFLGADHPGAYALAGQGSRHEMYHAVDAANGNSFKSDTIDIDLNDAVALCVVHALTVIWAPKLRPVPHDREGISH